jgi:broad specificity phosphatase PhoE
MSDITTVWLARHGEVHNPSSVLYGRLPRMRLSPEGQRQAGALADFLAARPLAAVYSSPMLRARRTAEVILARHPELTRIRIDRDLQEIRSAWEGEPLTALEAIDWDLYANPRAEDDESLQMIHDRMRRWLDRVLLRHAGSEVIGVSHGDPMLILVGGVRGLPLAPHHVFPRPYIETGVVFRLQFDATGACPEIHAFVPHREVAA